MSSLGQSPVIEFVIFFVVGMTLFVSVGNFFRLQSEAMQAQLSGNAFELLGNYFASAAVTAVDACKQCGTVENGLRISDTTFGYYLEVSSDQNGLSVSTAPRTHSFNTSVNNLNASVTFLPGSAPSLETINLTYDKNQNTLAIK